MKKSIFGLAIVLIYGLSSCNQKNPNLDTTGEDILDANLSYVDDISLIYHDTVYVPIYSDIYAESKLSSILLTATLSIRNTSLNDTTYISSIDYYNTNGELVRSYLDRTLLLRPMQSIDYVIDRSDASGGSGANFIVTWGANKNTKPIFQAVMITTQGQHGISFVVDGVSLKDKK